MALEGDTVSERANGSVLVFPIETDQQNPLQEERTVHAPRCRSDAGDPVFRLDFVFVDR